MNNSYSNSNSNESMSYDEQYDRTLIVMKEFVSKVNGNALIKRAIEMEVPKLIVLHMNTFADKPDIIKYGCIALIKMASIPDGATAAVDAGAPATIVSAMRKYKTDAEIMDYCTEALTLISKAPEINRASKRLQGNRKGGMTVAVNNRKTRKRNNRYRSRRNLGISR